MVLDPGKANELKGPPAIDGIGPSDRMDQYWKDADLLRRQNSEWAA
jgi:hypothetical protein